MISQSFIDINRWHQYSLSDTTVLYFFGERSKKSINCEKPFKCVIAQVYPSRPVTKNAY